MARLPYELQGDWRSGVVHQQLERSSDLAAPALSAIILLKTDGIIGEVATLLARAAIHAIRTGAERIGRQIVDACGHQSPSERRRSMERALS